MMELIWILVPLAGLVLAVGLRKFVPVVKGLFAWYEFAPGRLDEVETQIETVLRMQKDLKLEFGDLVSGTKIGKVEGDAKVAENIVNVDKSRNTDFGGVTGDAHVGDKNKQVGDR